MKRFTHCSINQITGAFVLLALLILGVGIYMAGRVQHWFERTVTINFLLPEEGCYGLKPGALVMVMGTEAGEITHINITPDNRMTANGALREDFMRFIGTDSRATIKKTLGVAGDAFVEINGKRGETLPAGALIETNVDRAVSDMLNETLEQIRSEIIPTIRQIHRAFDSHTQLTVSLEKPTLKALETFNSIITKIDKGDGLVSRVLADKQMADDIGGLINRTKTMLEETGVLVKKLQTVATRIDKISKNLIRTTTMMPASIENVNDQVKSLSGVIIQTQSALREIQRLTEAVQRHWLIRGYVEDEEPKARIPPKDVIVIP